MPYFMLFNIKYLDIAIFWKPSIVFFVKTLACLKYLRTFAPLLTKSTSEKKFWRGGRVVDCGGLENRCTARYPGFESLSLAERAGQKWSETDKKLQINDLWLFSLPESPASKTSKVR